MKRTKQQSRQRIHLRIRKKVNGTPECPRLCVFRSNKEIYCQIIDDTVGRTLAAASSADKDLQGGLQGLKKAEVAAKVGDLLASRAKAKGITKVRFDRGAYVYHGRVKALADGARKGGLEF